jgi:ketosteroid isomerase-like protein
MKKFTSFLLIILAILMFNCQSSNKSDKVAIRKLVVQWDDAIRAKDNDKIIELLAPDAVGLYSDAPILVGLDAFRKDNELMFASMETSSWESKLDTIVVSGNFAYNHGSYRYITKTQSGPVNYVGKWSTIWGKSNGIWKVVLDAANKDHPAEEFLAPVATAETFTSIENDWNTAVLNKDAKALDLLFAKEYTSTGGDGKVYDKQQDISDEISGIYKIISPPVISDVRVNLSGNVAVVNGINSFKGTYSGKDISGSYRFLDVFVMRDGRWQVISTLSSKLTKK